MIKEKKVRTKRVNSKNKGDRFERDICNLFKKRWGVTAYRTPGSGAYTSRAVSRAMKEAAMGDVVIEELPEIIFECKNYYSLHFSNWFKDNSKKESIWNFWYKLNKEANLFKKIPMLICKEDGSPKVVIMDQKHTNMIEDYTGSFKTQFCMVKGDDILVVLDLNELLVLDLEVIKLIIKDIKGDIL